MKDNFINLSLERRDDMSLFLAPIHKMMYHKIHFLDDLASNFATEEIKDMVNKAYPKVERGELAEVIDHNNIHGWLNDQVVLTEKRFAFIIESLLANGEALETLCQKASDAGKTQGFQGNAKEAFMALNGLFLDGMPCDRVLDPIEVSEEKMVWQITEDVHGNYWQDGSIYYKLRDAWTEGFLTQSSCWYEHQDNKVTIEQIG